MSTTTITSLLNSLHTHLQSQTQLLPALHNQLGLPQTALADDLSNLQKQLTECVESQIETRRKQVDEWMGKCDNLERECLRYTKALGGHGKATGSSVGEVRKEQVLPRRFEMISEHQEKLRQLYHTKLEQLTTLTNRVAALARILGQEFYPADILEPTFSPGESEEQLDPRRDVTPERFSKLEKELVRGKGEVNKRSQHLAETMIQIDWLYTELGIEPPPDEYSPSASTSTSISTSSRSTGRSNGSSLTSLSASDGDDPFLSVPDHLATPTPAGPRGRIATPFLLSLTRGDSPPPPAAKYQHIFSKFITKLEELTDEEIADPAKAVVALEGVEPTHGLVDWAESTCASLEDIKRRRESQIQAMYDQLEGLWKRLGVAESDMDGFVESQRGSTEATVKAYEDELERMLELKREKMSTFVENAREEIKKLWDDLMVSETERADFAPFADDEYTEDLLSIHEEEIRRLKEERKLKGTLLLRVKKYFDILQDEKDLAAAAGDQSRLLGRGPRDPGRLLREEKMRKRVTKEKPKLEQDLLSSIPAWEAETGRAFLVNGESMHQILMGACGANEKENTTNKRGKTQRAGSVTRSKTPSYAPSSSSSKPASNAPPPPVRPPSSLGASRNAPQRRERLGEASTSNLNHVVNPLPHPIVPMSSRATHVRAPSPSSLRPPSTVHGKTPMSSLPRPATRLAAPPSTGRVASAQQPRSRGRVYHPYQRPTRAASASASASRVYGAVGLASAAAAPTAGAIRKASRSRRESFKPRPSIHDDDWGGGGGDKRFAGFAGGMVEEEEDDDDF